MPRISASERAATRSRLLEAGKTEFAERGLAGARFDEISLAAGCAKGTIYNYFDSKEILFFTIVEEWCTQLVDAIGSGEASAREELFAIVELDVDVARKDPDLARVVVSQLPGLFGDHRAAVEVAIGPGIEHVAQVMRSGQERGELRLDQPSETLARLFLATVSAFEQEALDDASEVCLDDVVDLIDSCFLQGLIR